jgi:hypothetical protein
MVNVGRNRLPPLAGAADPPGAATGAADRGAYLRVARRGGRKRG